MATQMRTAPARPPRAQADELARYPLLDALIGRRSRRCDRGIALNGGPLAYRSRRAPQPLTLAEEAALAFADPDLCDRFYRPEAPSATHRPQQ